MLFGAHVSINFKQTSMYSLNTIQQHRFIDLRNLDSRHQSFSFLHVFLGDQREMEAAEVDFLDGDESQRDLHLGAPRQCLVLVVHVVNINTDRRIFAEARRRETLRWGVLH